MATAAKMALGRDDLHAIADKGRFSGTEILACHQAGITITVPRPETSGDRSEGMFVKADFHYEPDRDVYRGPAANEPPPARNAGPRDGRRGPAGRDARAPWPRPRPDDPEALHGRARIRHDQGLDGRNALPDAATEERANGNGAPRPRLQHQEDDLAGRTLRRTQASAMGAASPSGLAAKTLMSSEEDRRRRRPRCRRRWHMAKRCARGYRPRARRARRLRCPR